MCGAVWLADDSSSHERHGVVGKKGDEESNCSATYQSNAKNPAIPKSATPDFKRQGNIRMYDVSYPHHCALHKRRQEMLIKQSWPLCFEITRQMKDQLNDRVVLLQKGCFQREGLQWILGEFTHAECIRPFAQTYKRETTGERYKGMGFEQIHNKEHTMQPYPPTS